MGDYIDVSENRGYPQIIHFERVFHYKPSIFGYSTLGKSGEATFFLHLLSHVATPLFPAFRARFRNSQKLLPKVYRRSHFLQRGVVFGFLTII